MAGPEAEMIVLDRQRDCLSAGKNVGVGRRLAVPAFLSASTRAGQPLPYVAMVEPHGTARKAVAAGPAPYCGRGARTTEVIFEEAKRESV